MTDSMERYRKALEADPNNKLARFSLGKAYFDAGRFDEAQQQFQAALALRPDWMVVQILLGKCALSLGHRAEARQAFLRARQLAVEQHHEGPQAEMDQLLSELS